MDADIQEAHVENPHRAELWEEIGTEWMSENDYYHSLRRFRIRSVRGEGLTFVFLSCKVIRMLEGRVFGISCGSDSIERVLSKTPFISRQYVVDGDERLPRITLGSGRHTENEGWSSKREYKCAGGVKGREDENGSKREI